MTSVHVLKFGGSSLSNSANIARVAEIICNAQKSGIRPVVVVSAIGKTTYELIQCGEQALVNNFRAEFSAVKTKHVEIINELNLNVPLEFQDIQAVYKLFDDCEQILSGISLLRDKSPRVQDFLMAFGERWSARIMAEHLKQNLQIHALYIDGQDLGIEYSGNIHGSSARQLILGDLNPASYDYIRDYLKDYLGNQVLPVITGFIGRNSQKQLITMGRGGSDLSASIIGAAIGADAVEIWSDTNGVLSADPRIVPQAQTISQLTFSQASELAHFGAKILHPRSIQPAMEADIPVMVKNTFDAGFKGSLITKDATPKNTSPVVGITLKSPVPVLDIKATEMVGQIGFLSKLFRIFEDCSLSVDVIATSEVCVSVALDKDYDTDKFHAVILKLSTIADVKILGEHAIISLIVNPENSTDVLGQACHILRKHGVRVEMVSISASKLNICLVVETAHAHQMVAELHKKFFESGCHQ